MLQEHLHLKKMNDSKIALTKHPLSFALFIVTMHPHFYFAHQIIIHGLIL